MFFISVDSKRFRDPVSSLDATLTRCFIIVDSKGFSDAGKWGRKPGMQRSRVEQEATIVGEEKNRRGF
jgi:hypothetical protein